MPSPAPWPGDLDRYDEIAQAYFRFHYLRFDVLRDRARACARRLGEPPRRILDVGAGFQTLLLQREFPQAEVNTLGFEDPRFREGVRGCHYSFDLNRCGEAAARPDLPPHDLIVLAEVIEHLQVPPQAVLECLVSWLRPSGELLLQTPNAVSLAKRLRMLRGYNPFMMPQQPGDCSGHIREYTVAELKDLGRHAGLEVREVAVLNYFKHAAWKGELYRRLCGVLPSGLRDGITIAYARP